MKDKPIRQPWPRSARITVWVLGIIIAASAIVNIIAVTQWYDAYEKWNAVPIIMPDFEEIERAGEEICLPHEIS